MLREAAGDGRITAEELDERLEAALTARTYRELAALTVDLPATSQPGGVPVPEAKQLARINCGSGSAKRVGPWVVPQRMEVRLTSGHVKLDLRNAIISNPTLVVNADVRSGNLVIVTKPGIVVDADDVAVRSGHVRVKPHAGPKVPTTLRVTVSGKVASGAIVARPPRRSIWQWLTRQPATY